MLALSNSLLAMRRTVYSVPGLSPSIKWKVWEEFTAEICQIPSPTQPSTRSLHAAQFSVPPLPWERGPLGIVDDEIDQDFIAATTGGLDKRLVSAVWAVNNSHLPFLAMGCHSNKLAQTTIPTQNVHLLKLCDRAQVTKWHPEPTWQERLIKDNFSFVQVWMLCLLSHREAFSCYFWCVQMAAIKNLIGLS